MIEGILFDGLIKNEKNYDNDNEKCIYLMGYFAFRSIKDVKIALQDLKNNFNNKNDNNEILSSKWLVFRKQFSNWFKTRIEPIFLKEIELNNRYFGDE